MIVDDMTTSRMLIRSALEELGVTQIAMATDGEQALKALMVQPLPPLIPTKLDTAVQPTSVPPSSTEIPLPPPTHSSCWL